MAFPETAALIAGGQARRMGGLAKGLILVDGVSILHRQLALLAELGLPTRIIGDPSGPYAGHGAPVSPDLLVGHGPPGGVHAALSAAPAGWVCVLSVDLPRIDGASLRALAAHRASQHAVLAVADDHLQPLAGWWHTRTLPALDAWLRGGGRGFGGLLATLDVCAVPMPGAALPVIQTSPFAPKLMSRTQ